ncbi:hypothetical protein CXG81DRAFT_21243 [Caulochytrium protostelioides]|uniref:Uncharacterized protein n=1 Tax=Caulochytrium protostelioides TaxID=1555241 RepID=A0A4P9X0M8_9FUNG|nr:hypothetical protein CXG81DRAFT_21243 [Caulochytrium protostelioides]|eukprot:RKO98542.1 hypothetical protein CXG81DRAFT_21243 [Caulochytrium protostelioides]
MPHVPEQPPFGSLAALPPSAGRPTAMAHATDLPPSFDDFLVPLKSSLDFDACSLTAGTPLPHTGHPAAGAAADGAAKVSTTPPHPDPGSSATTLHVATPASLYPSPSAITAAAAAAAATIAAVKRSGHTRAPTVLPTPMLTNTRSDRRSRQPSNAITAAPAVDLPVDRDATWPHSDGGSGSGATSLMSLCWSTTHDDLLMPDYMAPEAPAWLKGVHDVNDDEDRPTPALPTCTSHRRRRYRRSADHVLPQPQPPPRPSPPQQHTRQPSPQLKAPSHVTADATSAASADNATCSGTMERSVSVSSGATLDLNLYLNIASSPAALSAPLSTPPGASAADAAALADAAAAAAALAATACANRLDDAHPSLTKAATLSSLLANALLPRQASSGLPVLSAPGPHAAPGTPGTAALSDFLPPEPSQIPEHQARPPALLPQPLGVAMVPPDIDWVRALADISSSAQSAFMSSSATTLSAADPFRPAGAPSTLAPPEHAAAAAAVAELLWSMDKENDDPFGPITTDPNGKALAEHPFPSTAARAARKRPFHALDSTSTDPTSDPASLEQVIGNLDGRRGGRTVCDRRAGDAGVA